MDKWWIQIVNGFIWKWSTHISPHPELAFQCDPNLQLIELSVILIYYLYWTYTVL